MIWLLRVLIIGLFSVAGERYFGEDQLKVEFVHRSRIQRAPVTSRKKKSGYRPSPKPAVPPARREPSYQPLSAQGRDENKTNQML